MTLDITDILARPNLRLPSLYSRESRNAPIHAVARNRSGNQSTLLGAPKTRYERSNQAKEPRDSTGASYDHVTQRVAR